MNWSLNEHQDNSVCIFVRCPDSDHGPFSCSWHVMVKQRDSHGADSHRFFSFRAACVDCKFLKTKLLLTVYIAGVCVWYIVSLLTGLNGTRERYSFLSTCREEVCYCIKDTSLFVQPVFSSWRHPPHLPGAAVPLLGHRQTQLILVGGWGCEVTVSFGPRTS